MWKDTNKRYWDLGIKNFWPFINRVCIVGRLIYANSLSHHCLIFMKYLRNASPSTSSEIEFECVCHLSFSKLGTSTLLRMLLKFAVAEMERMLLKSKKCCWNEKNVAKIKKMLRKRNECCWNRNHVAEKS